MSETQVINETRSSDMLAAGVGQGDVGAHTRKFQDDSLPGQHLAQRQAMGDGSHSDTNSDTSSKIGKGDDPADMQKVVDEARQYYLAKNDSRYLPNIGVDGAKKLDNGDNVQTTPTQQILTRPDGEKLTINSKDSDGPYAIDFKQSGDIYKGDGKVSRSGDTTTVHLGGPKDGEDVKFDSHGIISITNPYGDNVAKRFDK